MINVAIIASGSGTNAENIIKYFQHSTQIKIKSVYCNNAKAFIFERLKPLGIEVVLFSRENFYDDHIFIQELKNNDIEVLVLAGFLWLIPPSLIRAYSNKIINIHPALLPKYGGKGMYGQHVHEAVVANGDLESGITIHLVNENYDEGKILFQASCTLNPTDNAEMVAKKIHELEYKHYPKVIERVLLEND